MMKPFVLIAGLFGKLHGIQALLTGARVRRGRGMR